MVQGRRLAALFWYDLLTDELSSALLETLMSLTNATQKRMAQEAGGHAARLNLWTGRDGTIILRRPKFLPPVMQMHHTHITSRQPDSSSTMISLRCSTREQEDKGQPGLGWLAGWLA